ncbi:hypothetical protein COV23_01380 [Candidatus Wolfebacteria bacterium CG10_big_fil_rev_8_21_14_0_10_31_9]|uniref:Protein containing YHS domain protein n=1 Tax=Candidatus Wolfebacteria bacterium CG10_big_fil_rev_8_21_14_0_10_31_9 TaxID=1975070 RepID=A0A2H0RCF8_9BACT|nr:MAG: hypothetical protein COV23_01380 [Candidatus Wolfebacteria bacterium CG10_big_fil_rev_8_21_14_0_10_31_9]
MDQNICHTNLKYKICVSGAAETSFVNPNVFKIGEEIGREIIRHNSILVTGATTGFPYWAAKGAKDAGGIVIGFSPAANEKDHIRLFNLPTDHHDVIVYTGFHYSGRNLILTRASDAVIVGPGRIGTINEFTIAFEDNKPIGILEGDWETDDVIKTIIEKSHRAEERKDKIVFSKNPKELLDKLIEIIDKFKDDNGRTYYVPNVKKE